MSWIDPPITTFGITASKASHERATPDAAAKPKRVKRTASVASRTPIPEMLMGIRSMTETTG